MPRDRYNFDEQFDIDVDFSKLNTKWYDDQILSNEKDAKITARREARKAKYAKNADVKVISPEDITEGKKKQKKKIRTGRAVVLMLALAGVMALVGVSGVKLTSLQIEKKAAEKELARLEEKVAQLNAELKELDSEEYVENAARSELHMIREGEVMYIVDPGTEEEAKEDGAK